jgi:5-methylcytosine-specific restriction enzyme subunit McrC
MMAAQLPCIHHTRSADQLLNAVLLSGITLGRRLTSSPLRRAELRELEQRLSAEVRPARLGAHVFRAARAQLNRLVVGYERPLELIEMLHTCSGASWRDDASIELDGFLFDMNSFFQKLLHLFLSAHLPSGCEVQHEAPLHELFRYSVNPKNERPPKPRPDFTVRRGARMWLLDAKYRDLWCNALPASMLYQLSVYALSQGQGATAAILYPTESPEACEEVLTICAPRTGIPLGQVALRPVLMSRLVSALSDPSSDGARALARELAFGADRAHSLPEPERAQRTLLTSSVEPGG